jgi:hypothetical protein
MLLICALYYQYNAMGETAIDEETKSLINSRKNKIDRKLFCL